MGWVVQGVNEVIQGTKEKREREVFPVHRVFQVHSVYRVRLETFQELLVHRDPEEIKEREEFL